MKRKSINSKKMIYGIFLVCMVILMYLVPYMGDDWAWESQIGLDRLYSHFRNYNGRWAGNLLILVLSRSKIAA